MNAMHSNPALYRRSTLILAVIPSVDAVVNQLTGAFHLSFGSVSVLQVFRGIILVWFLATALYCLYKDGSAFSRVPLPAVAGLLMLGIISTKDLLQTGTLAADEAVAYGQMGYWLLLWIVASLVCREKKDATVLLRGLAVGAFVTAVSVILGYMVDAGNFYATDGVRSSAGWFNTAKMISGILVCGVVVTLYLGRGKYAKWGAAVAMLCSVACILTYARAGSVALVAVMLWITSWQVVMARRFKWQSARVFLITAVVAVVAALAILPTQAMFARWGDLSEGDQAGSGRAAIWEVAVKSAMEESAGSQLLGQGYSSMGETLFQGYGDDVKHTHNDMLDMVLVAGVLGVAWLCFLAITWISTPFFIGTWTLEGAAAAAVVLDYLCHAQFTGQIWGTDAMAYYVLAITSFSVLARSTSTHVSRTASILEPQLAATC